MQVFYCDHFELPLPQHHRFPIDKYRLTRERAVRELGDALRLRVAPAATIEQLGRVHEREYVERVFAGELSDLDQRRIGFPWSAKMLERSLRSVGQTIGASQVAVQEGVSVHLSGGTHHAFRDQGQGFCVFNDIAVAACELMANFGIGRVLVVDLDVHQGNGTASIFADDERVFTFSMHGDRNYPFRKTTSDCDVALPDGTGDAEYLKALTEAIEFQLQFEDVDFAFFIAGADPFEGDRMGRLKLSKRGLRERDHLVLDSFYELQIPVAVVLGGGYAREQDTAEIHSETVKTAHKYWVLLNSKASQVNA